MFPVHAIEVFAADVYDVVAFARREHAPGSARAIWNLPGIRDTWEIDIRSLRRVCEWVDAVTSFKAAYYPPLTADEIRIRTAAIRLATAIDASK